MHWQAFGAAKELMLPLAEQNLFLPYGKKIDWMSDLFVMLLLTLLPHYLQECCGFTFLIKLIYVSSAIMLL